MGNSKKRPYHFISVHHPTFDECGRLWFIDTGSLEYSPNHIFIRKPILWAFQVRRGRDNKLVSKLVLRKQIRESSYNGLRSLVVDVHLSCDDYHVYMPNHVDNEIVVYNGALNEQWNFIHPVLEPVLTEEIANVTEKGGVSSLALGKRDRRGHRPVYISIGYGRGLYVVNSRTLTRLMKAPYLYRYDLFRPIGYKDSNISTVAMDYDSGTKSLFFASVNDIQLDCWNTKKNLNPDTFAPAFTDNLLGRDVQVDKRGNVWYLSGSPEAQTGELLATGNNFVVHKFSSKELVSGTVCQSFRKT